MSNYVFDAFALMAYFQQEPGATTVADILKEILQNKDAHAGWITALNLGEIFYITSRRATPSAAHQAVQDVINFGLKVVEPDMSMCLEAAALKARFSLSYADCFAATLALRLDADLLTGDPEFAPLEATIGLRIIQLPKRKK